MAKPPSTTRIEATWLDDDGRGVGVHEGVEVHAADLLPGESATVRIDHQSPHRPVAWATRVGPVIQPSPHRVTPVCAAFGDCGGCAWQHCHVDAQLAAKRDRVARALAALGPNAPDVAPVVPAPEDTGYRSRGKYVVTRDADGRVMLGAYRPRTHEVVDTRACAVVEPAIRAVLPALCGALDATGLATYDEATRTGDLRYAVVRTGHDDSIVIAVVTADDTARAPLVTLAETLVNEGSAAGVMWVRNPSHSGAILAGTVERLAGHATVAERFGEVTVRLDITGFTQVNRAAATAMYTRLCQLVPEARRAVDLYCGTGAIAFYLAARGVEVLGIERHAPAVAAARRAAEAANSPARFEALAAEAAKAAVAAFAPDVVVVNPPRKGLSPAVIALLAAAAPNTIAYLSCGPESLARDLARFIEAGYRIDVVQPFDLMPGTSQVETLCVCHRGASQ